MSRINSVNRSQPGRERKVLGVKIKVGAHLQAHAEDMKTHEVIQGECEEKDREGLSVDPWGDSNTGGFYWQRELFGKDLKKIDYSVARKSLVCLVSV